MRAKQVSGYGGVVVPALSPPALRLLLAPSPPLPSAAAQSGTAPNRLPHRCHAKIEPCSVTGQPGPNDPSVSASSSGLPSTACCSGSGSRPGSPHRCLWCVAAARDSWDVRRVPPLPFHCQRSLCSPNHFLFPACTPYGGPRLIAGVMTSGLGLGRYGRFRRASTCRMRCLGGGGVLGQVL
jgi:hypothetical protein